MVSSKERNSMYDIKVSTVVPGSISGNNATQEITAMDLAMKLHYLRFVYYFRSTAFDGLTIFDIKEPMFDLLDLAYVTCGRFRRTESGRPFIKCNDSGMRIVEAKCHMSLDEWLESKDDSRHKFVVPNQVIGPDLSYSPLVMMQFTKFTCGAISVGISWSHVLGDAFSALGFINLWAQVMRGDFPAQPLTMAQPKIKDRYFQSPSPKHDPLSIKRVGPVGDLWSTSNHLKMETFSFYISESELAQLQMKICGEKSNGKIPLFECICVVIWQCVAKVRHGSEPEAVTICRNDPRNRSKGIITNESQSINLVKTDVAVAKYNPMDLGLLIMKQAEDERMKIEEAMEKDDELPDFLIYGANLTFVDMSDASLYEIEVRGQTPVYVNCAIDNIGDDGVVLVLPTPKSSFGGRLISITLPENQVVSLRFVLKEDWCIATSHVTY